MLATELPREATRPDGAHTMRMTWHDLLFAHWPLSVDELRPVVPHGLRLDKYDGRAWIGVIPFHMTGIGLRGLPGLPGTNAFVELNVRTYVTDADGEHPGVWFFSLDATSHLAIAVARRWYHLNYVAARMSCEVTEDEHGDRVIEYASRRRDGRASFEATYHPIGDPGHPRDRSFEHFLTERYCMYSQSPSGQLYRSEIHHDPWTLQQAEADIRVNTMLDPIGLKLPTTTPHLLYAKRCDALAWTPKRIG